MPRAAVLIIARDSLKSRAPLDMVSGGAGSRSQEPGARAVRRHVHLVLIAQGVLGPGAYLSYPVQVCTDVVLYIRHYALEAEGLERRQLGIFAHLHLLLALVARHA